MVFALSGRFFTGKLRVVPSFLSLPPPHPPVMALGFVAQRVSAIFVDSR